MPDPPLTTRSSTRKSILDHVLKDVMGYTSDNLLVKAIEGYGITSIIELITLSDDDIASITVKNENETIQNLPVHLCNVLKMLRAWNTHLLSTNKIRSVDWKNQDIVNKEEWLEFRVGIYVPPGVSGPPLTPRNVTPPPTSSITPRSGSSLASDFKKGIKRDKSHYKDIKDEKQWDEWKRTTMATIYAHGCENVISPSYVPTNHDDIILFNEQQKFMYDVWSSILKTPMGKHYVRAYEKTRDAQAVWRDYLNYMRTSTRADLEIEDLMTALTSFRLNSSYQGTTQQFIIDWLNKLRMYEDLTPVDAHFPEIMKKAMLQNAVGTLKVFKEVKVSEQLEIAKGHPPLSYPAFTSLIQQVAAGYDREQSPQQRRPIGTRQVNRHETEDDNPPNDYEYHSDDDNMNVDSFGSMSINQTNLRPSNFQRMKRQPSLPKAIWDSLSRTDQLAWDQISAASKSKIMFAYKDHRPPNPKGMVEHRSVLQHHLEEEEQELETYEDAVEHESEQEPDTTLLVQAAAQGTRLPPSDIRRVLSTSNKKTTVQKRNKAPTLDVHTHERLPTYLVSNHDGIIASHYSLVDRGANGGLAGSNMRVINTTDRFVNISGIDNHQLNGLSIVTAGGVVPTQRGDVVGIFHQYAHVPQGRTIHSSIQLESFGITVDDRSQCLYPGSQQLRTLEGYVLPLDFQNGLAYLPIRPFTDAEWDTLPHVVFTSDVDWNPSCVDLRVSDNDDWYDAISNNDVFHQFDLFNETGVPRAVVEVNAHDLRAKFHIHSTITTPAPRTFHKYRDYFLRASPDVIKRTFEATTQYARSGWITGRIYDTHRSPFPALNVRRRNEDVATDTFFSPVPAIDDGSICAQFFVGTSSKYVEVHGMKTDSQFIKTLWDSIRYHGAMDTLISDRAQVEISNKVHDVLRYLCINDRQSEPHYQHQNPAERRYKDVKFNAERVMNMTGAPQSCWLLCMDYVCFIMNRTALASLNWRTPFEALKGYTPDISMIYRFKFFDEVYFKRHASRGGNDDGAIMDEAVGFFVGFSERVGHAMTYKILSKETSKIIYRSRIRLASMDSHGYRDANLLEEPNGEDITIGGNEQDEEGADATIPLIDINDIIGRTYLSTPSEDGRRMRLRVIGTLDELDQTRTRDPVMSRFRAINSDETYEEVVSYNQLLQYLEEEDGAEELWKFKAIVGHQGPISRDDLLYNGSKYNVQISWENGETTWEPLGIIAKSDPVSVAIYAQDNGLLRTDGWKQFRKLAERQQRMLRVINQVKLQSFHHRDTVKFGVQVPRGHRQAMELDKRNGDTQWRDAEISELNSIDEYQTFDDLGLHSPPPEGYKRIRVHMVYDIKHDLRRKARLVADGNLTIAPSASVYSSVVSLRGLRMVLFLAELNHLQLWTTDVGNAYLEAMTSEKIFITAGPEFGEREGHTLVIRRALYGLRSSGARWWERFSDVLTEMGFFPSRAENDIWMRRCDDHYEYLARYVDDLAIASRDPKRITDELSTRYKFKLKGTGPINYHLGCDFFRDKTGTLCMGPRKYIDRMITIYEQFFGNRPRTIFSSPLERGDHPELDVTEELDAEGIKQYQSLIGAAQWLISLGRFDIATAIMTLSSFRVAPRHGHLERVKRVYGYISKMRHGAIRFRVEAPDYSDIPVAQYDWVRSVYGEVREVIPPDAPEPLGPPVVLTSYVDANLCHDMITGRSVTGIIHLMNKTPIDFFTKKQGTVETATFGSEFVAARTATEQIIELRATMRYLGINFQHATYLFGDNKSVVDSSINIVSRLHKRHVILSYHRVREAIAAGILIFTHLPGAINPADILSKAWGYQQVWVMLKALLFWEGDTNDID